MATKRSRAKLIRLYVNCIVDQSPSAWSALNKAVEREVVFSYVVISAKSPSEAWEVLVVEDENDDFTKHDAYKNSESLTMMMVVGEYERQYVAKVRGIAGVMKITTGPLGGNQLTITTKQLNPIIDVAMQAVRVITVSMMSLWFNLRIFGETPFSRLRPMTL